MTTDKGVWNLQQVRDKQLQSLWGYTNAGGMYITGGDPWSSGVTAQNDTIKRSSPVQVPGEWALEDSIFASGNKITGSSRSMQQPPCPDPHSILLACPSQHHTIKHRGLEAQN